MVDSDLPSKLLSILSKAADIVRGHNFIQVYSHYDADGITATSIVGKALHRAGKEYRITIFPTLIDEFMQVIESTPSECVIVTVILFHTRVNDGYELYTPVSKLL